MPRSAAGLGDLERAVLDVLWSADGDGWTTVRQVHARLAADRDIAYTTVMTVMGRLARKGVLVQRRAGRAYSYRAAGSRSELTAEMMRATLSELGEQDRPSALVAFLREADAEELQALRAALERLEGAS